MSLFDGDDFDPDSESARAAMMASLELETSEETVTFASNAASLPAASAASPRPPAGHNMHAGPPFLVCSVPWGVAMLIEADPAHSVVTSHRGALEALRERGDLRVWVDWAGMDRGAAETAYRLCVRLRGTEVGEAHGHQGEPISVTLDARAAANGEAFVAELSWAGGSRALHMLRPLALGGVCLTGLVDPGGAAGSTSAASLVAPRVGDGLSDRSGGDEDGGAVCGKGWPSRGLGMELELITRAPLPSEEGGCFTKAEELARELAAIEATLAPGDALTVDGSLAVAGARHLLERLGQWTVEVDDHVCTCPESVARATVEAERRQRQSQRHRAEQSGLQPATGAGSEWTSSAKLSARAVSFMMGSCGTMKTEFKSPPPPHELSFERGAAAEIAGFVRLLRGMGAGAPSISATGNGGCSLHVHVNVVNPEAGGEVLSAREVLNVVVAWIVYDAVTMRFARPWCWREPSMTGLYATGAEFSWREKAWEQGRMPNPNSTTYDVPTFVAGVRSVLSAPGYASLPEATKRELLFGRAAETPASRLGRYCSLNLRRLTQYGTLEVRRFYGSLDEEVLACWAHFCVQFVETFRGRDSSDVLGDEAGGGASLEEGLAALRRRQEAATPEELTHEMRGRVEPSTVPFLIGRADPYSSAGAPQLLDRCARAER